MKKQLLLVTLIVFLLPATVFAKEVVRLTSFAGEKITGVSASSVFEVELVKVAGKNQTKAVVEIDKELETYLRMERNTNGTVSVGLKDLPRNLQNQSSKNRTMKLKLYLTGLEYVSTSGASKIAPCEDRFPGNNLVVKTSGSSSIRKLHIDAKSARITCTGNSSVNLTTNPETLTAEASGSSRLKLNTGRGKDADISTTGSAKIEISGSSRNARLKASGSSRIQTDEYICDKADVELSGAATSSLTVNGSVKAVAGGSSRLNLQADGGDYSTFSVTGGASIHAKGSTREVEIRSSGSGKVLGEEYICEKATVSASGGSSVRIFAANSLKAKTSGSAKVHYKGNPAKLEVGHPNIKALE